VILAAERAARPSDFAEAPPHEEGRFCPFCPGNEGATPHELLRRRAADAEGAEAWSVRVFPNRYPALRIEGELVRAAHGLFDRISGVGAHEVIVETPRHDLAFADMSIDGIAEVLRVWRDRIVDLSRDERLAYVSVFKNQGAAAGATLVHEHSQLLALPEVPRDVAIEAELGADHWRRKQRCLTCDIIRQERGEGVRIVNEGERFVAVCPWASPTPFLVWILPKAHASHFDSSSDDLLAALAGTLRSVLRKVGEALEQPSYNLALSSGPLRGEPSPSAHWRLEVAPAVTTSGGFERASGCWINSTPPEEAAAFLRKVAAP